MSKFTCLKENLQANLLAYNGFLYMSGSALNAKIPDPLKEALDIAVAKRRTTQKAAIIEAVEAWIAGGNRGASKEDVPLTPLDLGQSDALRAVGAALKSGHITPDQVRAVLETSSTVQPPGAPGSVLPNTFPALLEEYGPWVTKTVQVLRSQKPGLPLALQANLTEFADTDRLWNESQGRQDASAAPAAAGGGRGRAPRNLAPINPDRPHRSGNPDPYPELTREIDEIERDQEESEKPKKRTTGKFGTRS
jgi:hypothetical protein